MLFPGSRIWYEGAVGDLVALTGEIRTAGFSGHVVLEFQDSLDIVICVGGEFIKVVEMRGGRLRATRKHPEIMDKCRTEPGRMTVFELPPALAQRLRGIEGRRVLCTGTAARGCEPRQILDGLRREGFSGILDADSPGGKLLLDFEAGVIVACYATATDGPALEGFPAFRSWHEAFARAGDPSIFSVAGRTATAEGQLWDEILMAGAERIRLPLPSSTERLAQRYGRNAAAGELLFAAGDRPGSAFYILAGEVELFPEDAESNAACRRLGPGALVGVSWLQNLAPARFGGRALVDSRYLMFGRKELGTVFANSPALAARCVRTAAALLARVRTRSEAFRAQPWLRDVEAEVVAALRRARPESPAGVPTGDLLRELTQALPLAPAEIDAHLCRLRALGSISHKDGRIALTLREL